MNDLAYARASQVDQALGAAQREPDALYLAGGTTVVDLLRERVLHPSAVIDISELPLRGIDLTADTARIGAMVSNSALAWHPALRERVPAISQALLSGASPQIRNMASVGGNLLQRTRCPYFRDLSAPCNKRQPGSGCAGWDGYNRSLAVLGGSRHCIATHPSDFTVALTAFDAVVELQSEQGRRSVPITEFYLRPGSTPHRENVLRPGELVLGVAVPLTPSARHSLYRKVRDRQSFEFALCSVAVGARVEDGKLHDVRLALGGVGTVPWRAHEAEAILEGQPASPERFDEAAKAVLATAEPRPHNGFKVELARRTIVAALEEVMRA